MKHRWAKLSKNSVNGAWGTPPPGRRAVCGLSRLPPRPGPRTGGRDLQAKRAAVEWATRPPRTPLGARSAESRAALGASASRARTRGALDRFPAASLRPAAAVLASGRGRKPCGPVHTASKSFTLFLFLQSKFPFTQSLRSSQPAQQWLAGVQNSDSKTPGSRMPAPNTNKGGFGGRQVHLGSARRHAAAGPCPASPRGEDPP